MRKGQFIVQRQSVAATDEVQQIFTGLYWRRLESVYTFRPEQQSQSPSSDNRTFVHEHSEIPLCRWTVNWP